MGYSIFRFGSLYLEGNIQNIPQKPKEHRSEERRVERV